MARNILLLILTILIGCQRSPQNTVNSEAQLSQYISEYSKDNLSVKDPIIIRFNKPVIQHENTTSVIKIEPKVEGMASWKDANTLVFKPEKRLSYGRKYLITMDLDLLYPESKSEKSISFQVNTKPLEYMISLDPALTYHKDGAQLSGQIISSDWVEDQEIETLLRYNSNDAKVSWTHSANKTVHRFILSNIKRTNTTSSFTIAWEDTDNDETFAGQKDFVLAAKDEFAVSDIRTHASRNAIVLNFTEPLDEKQILEGLVTLKDYKGQLTFDINGSVATIFPSDNLGPESTINISPNILSSKAKKLGKEINAQVTLEPIKPQVKLVGRGVITPYQDAVIFPFEAIGLHAVDVEIVKIFENNILQYLQYNQLDQKSYYLEPVGRIIYQQKVNLSNLSDNPDYHKWTRYTLDLQNLTNLDPGALYIVRIGYRGLYTDYPCDNGIIEDPLSAVEPYETIMRWNRNYPGYKYSQRNNPCYPAYYNESKFIQRNVLASNLAIMVKGGKDNRYHIMAKDLTTLEPLAGVDVTLFDYQKQSITTDKTDVKGEIVLEAKRKPSFVMAQYDNEYAYLNIQDEHSNELSSFAIGGREKKFGIDGYLFGERGVWRPGDTIFLTFALEDNYQSLPKDYPMSLEVRDARGKIHYKESFVRNDGDLYTFRVPTEKADFTGNWRARIEVGDNIFQQILKVETIKPNRLRVNLQLPEKTSIYAEEKYTLSGSWLHGAPAANLRTKIVANIVPIKTEFENYRNYNFDDPARKVSKNNTLIYDQALSARGKGTWSLDKINKYKPPGKVNLHLKSRIYEKTGEYSTNHSQTQLSYYNSYVGVNIPQTPWGRKQISNNEYDPIKLVVLSEDGKPIPNRKITVGLYEAEWTWWYNQTNSNIYRYDQSNHLNSIEKVSLTTNSKGEISWKPKNLTGYRYLVRACDSISGHCTGELFFTPYNDYQSNEGAASILSLKTDKDSYNIGEKIELNIPSNENSSILVTIENGNGVLGKKWYKGEAINTKIEIESNYEMSPNIYIHVSLIQKYGNKVSELPLRMYGVVPVKIVDPNTRLKPIIEMADELKPKENFQVTISEENGQPMHYTLAVVDEGLLGLTNHNTPDLWKHFYAKQALGVKTWDIYDQVLQGHGGQVDKYISIGGDGLNTRDPGDQQSSRFDPVVQFFGPFHLSAGRKIKHKLTMENYMGAVRVMIVARHKNAYGSVDKSVPVKNPIMVLPTMPRILSPGETFDSPINVIVTDDKIKDVSISMDTGPGLQVNGSSNLILRFDQPEDKIAPFSISIADDYQGTSYIDITAKGNGKSIKQKIQFSIINPSPSVHQTIEKSIAAGKSTTISYKPIGIPGTQSATLEISSFPSINLKSRLDYLLRYPYGCVEQTISAAFPQLYLADMMDLRESEKANIKNNIQAAIKRLQKFQTTSGGFTYWMGSGEISDWGSSYAGHFLLEAKEKGYFVDNNIIDRWLSFQRDVARNWKNIHKKEYEYMMQAYRLYTLAKAGQPAWGAMNNLRLLPLSPTATYTLAAAYAYGGQVSVAEKMIGATAYLVEDYQMLGHTYGSALRDKSLVTEAFLSASFGQKHYDITSRVLEITRDLGKENWYSTQTTAFALLTVGKYLERNTPGELTGFLTLSDGSKKQLVSSSPIYQLELDVAEQEVQEITINNKSQGVFYARINLSGQSHYGKQKALSRNLSMKVVYKDLNDKLIDISDLTQGTDFIAEVTVINPGSRADKLEEMVLSQAFPSGWEIQNERMTASTSSLNDHYDYRDIRDDRVNTFFDMDKKKVYRTRLTATYTGKYYLPDIQCEAMYDHQILARIPGQWITVSKKHDF